MSWWELPPPASSSSWGGEKKSVEKASDMMDWMEEASWPERSKVLLSRVERMVEARPLTMVAGVGSISREVS